MKKLVIGITIAVMVLSISAMSAFAASEAPGYVDADGRQNLRLCRLLQDSPRQWGWLC